MLMESWVKLRSQQNIVGTSKNQTRMQEMAPNSSSCIMHNKKSSEGPRSKIGLKRSYFQPFLNQNLPKVFDLVLNRMLRVKITYLLNQLWISGLLETLDLGAIFMFFHLGFVV